MHFKCSISVGPKSGDSGLRAGGFDAEREACGERLRRVAELGGDDLARALFVEAAGRDDEGDDLGRGEAAGDGEAAVGGAGAVGEGEDGVVDGDAADVAELEGDVGGRGGGGVGSGEALDRAALDDWLGAGLAEGEEGAGGIVAGPDDEAETTLLRAGAYAMPAIMAKFPGPIALEPERLVSGRLPRVADCGPVIRLIASQRRTALPFVLSHVEGGDADARFWAT